MNSVGGRVDLYEPFPLPAPHHVFSHPQHPSRVLPVVANRSCWFIEIYHPQCKGPWETPLPEKKNKGGLFDLTIKLALKVVSDQHGRTS
jgi:hypothetical protein